MRDDEHEYRRRLVTEHESVPLLPMRSTWPSAKRIVSTTVTVVIVPLLFTIGYGLINEHIQVVLLERRVTVLESNGCHGGNGKVVTKD